MRKALVAIGVIFTLLLAFFLGSELIVSHYRRWQASRLLAEVREFHPGVTTEAQALSVLKPFSGYAVVSDRRRDTVVVHEVEYQLYNTPAWTASVATHLRLLPLHVMLPCTLFIVDLEFAGGRLFSIHINEMQEDHPGYAHPNAAVVTITSRQFGALPESPFGRLPLKFNGYSEHSQSTGRLDERGDLTAFSCCHERFIEMDERATPQQRKRALNFQLHCMTSIAQCKSDHEILP